MHDPQVAKTLQNTANRTCANEPYMKALDPFVENNKARVNQFLNALCEVGDLHDTPEVVIVLPTLPLGGELTDEWIADGPIYGTL